VSQKTVERAEVLEILRGLDHPGTGKNLIEADVIRALTVDEGRIRFVLEVAPEHGAAMEPVRQAAVSRLEALVGPGNVSALLTAHSDKKPPDLKIGRHPDTPKGPQKIPGVQRIIAIASGKGGVGKSTVASNLAVALAAEGKRVGMLDADVYGPSQPRMLGITGRPASPDGKTILPLRNHGVTLMSIGLLTKEDEAVVWRGPMLMGALQQMLGQVQWGQLDVLIVDLPPGTGDVQMTLSQKAEVTGAIVVSTPQDVALLDTRKALNMFDKMHVNVLGMIENMSTYICPNGGHEAHIFGHGGARADAERLGIPFLGEIPLDIRIRETSDAGTPIVVAEPDGPHARTFREIGSAVWEGVQRARAEGGRAPPKIVVE
jgi:ATP-binding protein involved in chromosome partitioning